MVYIGPYNSGAARASIPTLNNADLVMISPSNTYAGLTKPGKGQPNEPAIFYPTGKRNYARVVPADDIQGAVGAGWAKQLGAARVFVLHDTELYGHAVALSFADTAARIGLEIVGGPEGVDPRGAGLPGAGGEDPRAPIPTWSTSAGSRTTTPGACSRTSAPPWATT